MVQGKQIYTGVLGIVVFLLTALVFLFWYDDSYELAERHMTVVRFNFYRVIWIEALCGIGVAWAVWKKFRFCWLDAAVVLLGGYVLIRSLWGGAGVTYRWELWILFTVLYFIFRMLSSLHRKAIGIMLFVVMLVCLFETLYGFGQLYGWSTSRHSLYRLTGSFFNPGPYSGFLVIVLPVVLYYGLVGPDPWDKKDILRQWPGRLKAGLVWGILLLILSILPAGMSRSSWLAAITGCGIVLAFHYRIWGRIKKIFAGCGRKAWWGVGIAGVMMVLLLAGMYWMKKDSADGRKLMWKIAALTIAGHPWEGVGLGYFSGAFGETQAAYFEAGDTTDQEEWVAGAPEYGFNEYLQIGVELGLIGLGLFVCVLGLAVWQLLCSAWPEKIGILGGIAAFMVFACFSYPLNVIPLIIVFVLFLALAGTVNDSRQLEGERRMTACSWGIVVFALLLAGITWRLTEGKQEQRKAYVRWGEEQKYFGMDIFEGTVDNYKELYPQLKDQPKFLFEYGQCLSKTGQYEAAIRILAEGTHLSADPMFYNIMGKNAQALKDYETAEMYFLHAAQMIPHRLYPFYLLAKMYFESGQVEKGKRMAQKVIQKEPKVMSDAVREMKAELKELLK